MAPSQENRPTSKEQNAGSVGGKSRRSSRPSSRHSVPLATPPDGGWGWVIVMASFMISVLVDGVCFTMGIFFNPFREHFNTTKAETSWVGSVLNGSYLSIGPLVSALVNKFGCRKVAMVGSVFAACSFFISTFSTSMPVLIVTYGLLGGAGFGLAYLPAIVMVGYYFERRRALATGIACCGSGVGAFVFAPLCNFLLEQYGWKGATWILSALVLNGVVFSLFYRPLLAPPPGADTSFAKNSAVENGEQAVALLSSTDPPCEVPKELSKPFSDITSGLMQANGSLTELGALVNGEGRYEVPMISIQLVEPSDSTSVDVGDTGFGGYAEPIVRTSANSGGVTARDVMLVTSQHNVYNVANLVQTVTPAIHSTHTTDTKAYMSDLQLKSTVSPDMDPLARMAFSHDALRVMGVRKRRDNRHPRQPQNPQHHSSTLQINNPLRRSDIFYSGSLRNLPEFQSSTNITAYRNKVLGVSESTRKTNIVTPGTGDTDSESESEEEEEEEEGGVCRRWVLNPLLTVFDVSLLKSPTFVIYGLSCFLCMLGFFVPFMYLPTFGQDMGVEAAPAAFLISIIGIANTVGRVAVGFVSDQPWADCLLINNIALVIGGVATCLVPFFRTFPLLATYAFVFGTCIAVFVSLRSIIMVELMGLEKLTNAFGLVIMFQGISSFIGAPIAGFLSDVTGDYNISFYVAGAVLALAGGICIPLRRVARWENRKLGLVPVDILSEPKVEFEVK